MIAEQDRNETMREETNENEVDEQEDEDAELIPVPQDIARDLINNNEAWRQSIISQINVTNQVGRTHRFLPLGPSQRPNPYEGNRLFYAQWDLNVTENQVREILNENESSNEERPNPYEGNRLFYAQWDPNVSENQVREFLNDNDSSDDEITWGRNSEEDEDQHRREEEKIFGINDSDDDSNDKALVTLPMDTSLFTEDKETKYDSFTKNTWIADSGASTHMCNSDEGMFQCHATPNQYIKVGNGNKLPI